MIANLWVLLERIIKAKWNGPYTKHQLPSIDGQPNKYYQQVGGGIFIVLCDREATSLGLMATYWGVFL